jgi:Restriction endonuclease
MNSRSERRPLPGRDFQDLIAAIEKSLAPVDHLVTSPMRVRDRDTGQLREHDVVIDLKSGRHPFRIAIEARDRGRKVGSPDVEGFRAKCERTGIDRGIIVSSRGFTDPALKKANADNIGCQTLTEAKAFDWCEALFVVVRQRDAMGEATFLADLGDVDPSGQNLILAVPSGSAWSKEMQIATADSWLNKLPIDSNEIDGETYTKQVRLDDPPLVAIWPDGRSVPVKYLLATLSYKLSVRNVPIRFHSYRTQAGVEVRCDLATADVGGVAGRMVMVRQPDGSIKLSLLAGHLGA